MKSFYEEIVLSGMCQQQTQAVNHDQMGGVVPVKQRANVPPAFLAVVQRQKGNAQKSPPLYCAVMQPQQADTDGKQRHLNGGAWTGFFDMDSTHAEPRGYLAGTQTPDGTIHILSSRLHYRFNLKWVEANR